MTIASLKYTAKTAEFQAVSPSKKHPCKRFFDDLRHQQAGKTDFSATALIDAALLSLKPSVSKKLAGGFRLCF